MNQWNPSSLQIKCNQSSATSEFRFYNTSAFSGKITKVVITFSALTVSDASKLMFLGGTSEVSATTGGTAGTWDSSAKTLTWTPGSSDNFTYFAFYQNGKAASGNNYLATSDAIVVTYESAGGGGNYACDELNREFTGVTKNTTSYSSWKDKSGSGSDAVYAGNSAGNYDAIQIRGSDNSGIVSTTSGGTVKSVTVTWNSNTASGRTLNVYGKNTAYESASDLYNSSKQGTLLGTIVYNTSTSLDIDGSYEYIGLRSSSSAMYLTKVTICWGSAAEPCSADPIVGSVSLKGPFF